MNATELAWFKISYSSADGDDCVEVYAHPAHVHVHVHVHVRDSKAPARPHLTLSPGAWSAFVVRLQSGSQVEYKI